MKKPRYESDSPFEGTPEPDSVSHTLEEVDAALYGKVSLPIAGGQRAAPISLDSITPDPTQPRREVPTIVRKRAREDGLAEWQMWHQMAERQAGHEIPLKALLRGEGEGAETEKTGMALVDGFMALVALAASIHEKGLVNPITVSPRGMDQYMIETGERRYQAYKLLYGTLGLKRFSKIVANTVESVDVWRQAAENGSRKPLNAIGMARQIALLIMALNTDKDYAPFESFEGQSDRVFYAQVADGVIHRIPKGESERILQATGMKSRNQIANYRALLDVSDELWQQADEDDWTENRIREHILSQKRPDMFTGVNISNMNPLKKEGHLIAANGPATYPLDGEGQKFMCYQSRRVQLEWIAVGGRARIWYLNGDERERAVEVMTSNLIDLLPGKATGTLMLYRGKEVELVDYTPRKDNTVDALIWHLDRNGTRTFTQTLKYSALEDLPHPEQGLPTGGFPSPAAPFIQPKIQYDAIGSNGATRLEVGQQRKQPSGRVVEILSVLGNEVSYAEISPATGKPMGRFLMHINHAIKLPIVSKDVLPNPQVPYEDDEEDHFDKDAAMSSILGEEPRPPAPVKGTYVKYWEYGKPRAEGTVTDFQWRDAQGDYLTLIQTEAGVKEYWSKHLAVADQPTETVDNPLSTQVRPLLPSWAVEGVSVETISGSRGVISAPFWNEETNGWKAIVINKYGEKAHHVEHLMPLTAPLDETDQMQNDLPEWASYGRVVLHRETGNICDVVGTGRDDQADVWMLRVTIRGVEGQHDAPVSDFDAYVAPRHPGMEPKNLTRVVTEEQFKIGPRWNLASDYKMRDQASAIGNLRVITPDAIRTFLRQDGTEGAYARLTAWLDADQEVITAQQMNHDALAASVFELARQMVEEMAQQHGS